MNSNLFFLLITILFNFLSTLSFLLDVFQYLAKPPCTVSSHWSLPLVFNSDTLFGIPDPSTFTWLNHIIISFSISLTNSKFQLLYKFHFQFYPSLLFPQCFSKISYPLRTYTVVTKFISHSHANIFDLFYQIMNFITVIYKAVKNRQKTCQMSQVYDQNLYYDIYLKLRSDHKTCQGNQTPIFSFKNFHQ